MDNFKFSDIKVEKANDISRYRRNKRITTVFRFVELFVFLIFVSRFSTQAQFDFSFKLFVEHFRGIYSTLISPRFAFLLGNAIVITLFFISGTFSTESSEQTHDFYEEYVKKCRNNQLACTKEVKKAPDAYKSTVSCDKKIKTSKSYTENLDKEQTQVHAGGRDLRRSMTEKYGKTNVDCGRKVVEAVKKGSLYLEDKMSGEEFRQTVEAFIARQQRILMEE